VHRALLQALTCTGLCCAQCPPRSPSAHSAPRCLLLLMLPQAWTVGAFTAFFVCFNALPATLELMTLAFTAKSSFVSY